MKVILSKLSFHWSVLVIFTSLRKRLKSILARALVRVQCQGRGNGVVVNAGVAIYFFTRRSSDRSREARNFFSLSWNYESPPYLIDSTFIKLYFTKINHLIKLVVHCVLKKNHVTLKLPIQCTANGHVTPAPPIRDFHLIESTHEVGGLFHFNFFTFRALGMKTFNGRASCVIG